MHVTRTQPLRLKLTHRKQESLWGRCVISMSLSLVVKTAKHRMLSLHAAVSPTPHPSLPPTPQSRETMAERRGGQVDDGPSQRKRGPLAWSWSHMYRCWYFKSRNWLSPLFLLWDTTQGVHREGHLLGLWHFRSWFGLRCGSSLGTRQKCRAESRTQLLV